MLAPSIVLIYMLIIIKSLETNSELVLILLSFVIEQKALSSYCGFYGL